MTAWAVPTNSYLVHRYYYRSASGRGIRTRIGDSTQYQRSLLCVIHRQSLYFIPFETCFKFYCTDWLKTGRFRITPCLINRRIMLCLESDGSWPQRAKQEHAGWLGTVLREEIHQYRSVEQQQKRSPVSREQIPQRLSGVGFKIRWLDRRNAKFLGGIREIGIFDDGIYEFLPSM